MNSEAATETAAHGRVNINRIFVVGPSWLGDMVMAQSLFMLLREQYPKAHLSVLSPKWCIDVVARMPEVDDVIEMPVGHGKLHLRARWQLAKSIRKQNFDLAIVVPGSLKSALIPFMAGIALRRGYLGEMRYVLLNDWRKLDRHVLPLNVQHYAGLAFARNLQWQQLASKPPNPKLTVFHAQQSKALTELGLHANRPVLALCPGAEYGPAKQWPATHYAQVASTMRKLGWQVWLFGSAKDVSICQQIEALAKSDEVYVLAGKTSISQAIDLMALANYVVTNDSGLMHVAAALERPLIALYGSSSDDFTPPLTDKASSLNLHLACSPCFKRHCPLGHTNCLQHLLPSQVIEIITKDS